MAENGQNPENKWSCLFSGLVARERLKPRRQVVTLVFRAGSGQRKVATSKTSSLARFWGWCRAGHGCTCRLPGPVPMGIFISKLIPAPVKDFFPRITWIHGSKTYTLINNIIYINECILGGEGGGGGGEQPQAHAHSFSRAEGDGWWWQQTTPSKTSIRARGGRWLVVAVVNNTPLKTSVHTCRGRWPRWVVVAVTNNVSPLTTSMFAHFRSFSRVACCGWCQVVVAAAR